MAKGTNPGVLRGSLQPSSMGGYFTGISRVFHGYGYGELVLADRPSENTSMRVITRMEVFSRGQFVGTYY